MIELGIDIIIICLSYYPMMYIAKRMDNIILYLMKRRTPKRP